MRITLILILTLVLLGAVLAREEVTYDPDGGDDPGGVTYDPEGTDEEEETTPTTTGKNLHEPGVITAGLTLGFMTWPENAPYGHDGGGFMVGVSGAYYFMENLAAKLGLGFGLGEYTTMIHVDLGAQYNIPLSEMFTAFVGAGLALDMGSWKEFDFNDRDDDDPEDRNDPVYDDGDKTQVGFNINGGIEFFVMDGLSLRPTMFFDFAGSVQWAIGLGVSYYF